MTNAERIRAEVATDEGLAKFLMTAHDGELHISFCRNEEVCTGEDDPYGDQCVACMMAWLGSPAEGDFCETEKSN